MALGEVHPGQAEVELRARGTRPGRSSSGRVLGEQLLAQRRGPGASSTVGRTARARVLDRPVKSARRLGRPSVRRRAPAAGRDRRPARGALAGARQPSRRVQQRRLAEPALAHGGDPGEEQVVVERRLDLVARPRSRARRWSRARRPAPSTLVEVLAASADRGPDTRSTGPRDLVAGEDRHRRSARTRRAAGACRAWATPTPARPAPRSCTWPASVAHESRARRRRTARPSSSRRAHLRVLSISWPEAGQLRPRRARWPRRRSWAGPATAGQLSLAAGPGSAAVAVVAVAVVGDGLELERGRVDSARWPASSRAPAGAASSHASPPGTSDPQALRPQRAGPVAAAVVDALEVGRACARGPPGCRPGRGTRSSNAGPGPVQRREQLAQPARSSGASVEGVDEAVGVAQSRERKWPGMPTPASGTPTRRADLDQHAPTA